jgi:hypothetical protein
LQITRLIALVVVGAVTYVGSVLGLWILSGRPRGSEQIVLDGARERLAAWTRRTEKRLGARPREPPHRVLQLSEVARGMEAQVPRDGTVEAPPYGRAYGAPADAAEVVPEDAPLAQTEAVRAAGVVRLGLRRRARGHREPSPEQRPVDAREGPVQRELRGEAAIAARERA